MTLQQKYRAQLGYTIDQTILIVAVIAILITMIIGSVGWDLLSRAGGTKLVSHLKQFEQANGTFFSTHTVWPHEALSGGANPTNNFRALITESVLDTPYQDDARNLLPSYTDASPVQHDFGGGGNITMTEDTYGNQQYLKIIMTGVPVNEYNEADENIDGEIDMNDGRVRGSQSGNTVTMEYFANAIN